MAENYYRLLGVSRDATDQEIKRAYRRLARELHPDVNPDKTAQDKYKAAAIAYETLSDPQKRKAHDETLQQGAGGFFGRSSGTGRDFNAKADAAQPPHEREDEVMRRAREFAAELQERNRQMGDALKGKAPTPPAKEPSLEELKQDVLQEFADFFGNIKKKFGPKPQS